MPLAGPDVAVVGDDVPDQREYERQGVRRDFADAVIGRVGHPYAMPRARGSVDGIETRADPADNPELRQRGDDPLGDGRVLQQDAGATGGGRDHVRLGSALRGDELDARAREQLALEIDIRELVIGKQYLGHRWRRSTRHGRIGPKPRYVAVARRSRRPESRTADGYNRCGRFRRPEERRSR